MAPSLLSLPAETIAQICAKLCHHCSSSPQSTVQCDTYGGPRTLASLSLTSKTLCAIAQPILYHSIESRNQVFFLRTLIARPDLASKIRVMTNVHNYDELDEADFSSIEAAAERLEIALPEGWRNESWEHGDTIRTRLFDLILACATGVEAMNYTTFMDLGPGTLLSSSGTVLPSLRHLRISHWDTEGGFDLAMGEDLFKVAPNIESLQAHMCGSISPTDLRLGNVKALHFTYSEFRGDELALVIKACPLLEQFSFNFGNPEASDEAFTPGEAMQALRTRKDTLTHLDLEFDKWDTGYLEFREEPLEEDDLFGSFAEFSKLETLIVPAKYIFADDEETSSTTSHDSLPSVLPESLKFLALTDSADNYADELAEAIGRGQFPNLKIVAMPVAERYEELEKLFGARGVEYAVYDPGKHYLPRWELQTIEKCAF